MANNPTSGFVLKDSNNEFYAGCNCMLASLFTKDINQADLYISREDAERDARHLMMTVVPVTRNTEQG